MIKVFHLINKKKINKETNIPLSDNKEEQVNFLTKLHTLELNDLKRSYNQYICQTRNKNRVRILLLNIFALFATVPSILLFCMNGVVRSGTFNSNYNVRQNAIYCGVNERVIPDSLMKKYKIIKYDNLFILSWQDIKFIINNLLTKKPFSFYFNLKIITKIAIYSGNIRKYNPDAIIATSEYSFTSSMLTMYCNENDVLHFNVMHGDKLFNIRDSFFRFNKCYIWDNYYKELFIKMNAEPMQFKVEIPSSFLSINYGSSKTCKSNNRRLTYYLQYNSREELIGIRERLKKLNDKFIIFIRPHPLYSDINLVKEIFKEFNIENNHMVKIEDSIAETDYLVSLYSTVLFEGCLLDKNIVIDDLVDEKYYYKLKELDYIMINKPHMRLSEMITNVENEKVFVE